MWRGYPDPQACRELKRTENAIPTVLFTVGLLACVWRKMEVCVDTMALTVVVVEHVGVAVTKNSLATRSVGVAVGAVYEFTATLDEVFAALINEWAAGALGSTDPNAVSEWSSAQGRSC